MCGTNKPTKSLKNKMADKKPILDSCSISLSHDRPKNRNGHFHTGRSGLSAPERPGLGDWAGAGFGKVLGSEASLLTAYNVCAFLPLAIAIPPLLSRLSPALAGSRQNIYGFPGLNLSLSHLAPPHSPSVGSGLLPPADPF